MTETIKWNYVAQVMQGPSVSAASSLVDIDAYDKFNVSIADGATQAVNLVPSGASISLLVINPKAPDKKLTYDLAGSDVLLDGPHVLIGKGAVSLLNGATSLTFDNQTGSDAMVEILVGRDATP